MFEFNIGETLKQMAVDAVIDFLKKSDRVLISDTTLRDGEQAPGAALDPKQKLKIARQLDRLGVDSIEAGFPAAGPEETEGIKLIAKEVKRPTISALARCLKEDIDSAARSLEKAKQWGIALFIGTSPQLREYSLNSKPKDEIIDQAKKCVEYAKKYTDIVIFAAEDSARTEPEFLYELFDEVIISGAKVIAVTDTIGDLLPEETAEMITGINRNVRYIEKALIGAHFHNDLGLAVANTLTALESGANIAQCTVNGLGERAGNASLEEVVMALRSREDRYGLKTNINTREFFKTSKLVSELTGIPISPNKPIVGKDVFATESGIHQESLLRDISSYEMIKPVDVGQKKTKFVLGRHSGRHVVVHKLKEFGYQFDEDEHRNKVDMIYCKFKELAMKKKRVEDSELADIARHVIGEAI